jgi:uncharacterized repeat protein (TIGR03806 family)
MPKLQWSPIFSFIAACASADAVPAVDIDTRPGPTACRAPHAPPAFRLSDAFPGVRFERPTSLARVGSTYLVAEQGGTVERVSRDGAGWRSDRFLDIADRIALSHGEAGLIGFAASPDFETSGEVFVTYTTRPDSGPFRIVISRLASRDGGLTIDPSSEENVLTFASGNDGHFGGHIGFGPDRNLYMGAGDGSWGDPDKRAQNPNELRGKILRLDVLGGRPYRAPLDNPFAGGGGRPEVYALGVRNPWSFSFDGTGRMWLGDVGHALWEEIDIVTKGGNYGWPLREGGHCFTKSPCDVPGATEPVFDYPHVDGFAVVGGLVYRGTRLRINGNYVFGDFMTGRIWALEAEPPRSARPLIDSGVNITGFAQDEDNEVLVLDYSGHVLRIEPTDVTQSETVTLAGLGCLDATKPTEMASGLLPYEVTAQLWSDGLDKRRWFALPAQTSIHVTDDGKYELPPGSLLLKEFSEHGRRVETRMFVRDADFGWQGYTFEWNAAQTDAVLLDESKTTQLEGSTWTIPSRAQCFACHAGGVGRVLGFQPEQLNRNVIDTRGEQLNQLARFSNWGLFDRAVDAATTPALRDPYDASAPIESRARSYLHANCSFCHGAAGGGQGLLDLRATVPVDKMNVLCRKVSFLMPDDRVAAEQSLVLPGDPDHSLLIARMGTRELIRMPPLGTGRVDSAGVDAVASWIRSLSGCP